MPGDPDFERCKGEVEFQEEEAGHDGGDLQQAFNGLAEFTDEAPARIRRHSSYDMHQSR
jgi:hypothetical protein